MSRKMGRMAVPEKPKAATSAPPAATTPPRAAARSPARADAEAPSTTFPSAVMDAARNTLAASVLEKRPYLKYAFANPYNLSLFVGALAAAGLTLNPVLAVAALGLEALWLLHGPDSKRLRHLLWDPK